MSGKMTTDTVNEDDNFGTEHSQRVCIDHYCLLGSLCKFKLDIILLIILISGMHYK